GVFGADGHAPVLGGREGSAVLTTPAYSQSALPEHVGSVRAMMRDLVRLLARCGVATQGARVHEFAVRRSSSSYPAAADGVPRREVRLVLPDGLSFVERVGYRYCVDKWMRASAAAVYWRLASRGQEQRIWMSDRLSEIHDREPALAFAQARQVAAVALMEREPAVFPHASLMEG